MSPARSRRTPLPQRRNRADIVKAVGAAAGIVLGTALLVWLMRPGPAGIPGTGGLINRQPRMSWLLGLALGLSAIAAWWILRVSRRARGHAKVVLPVSLGVVAVAAVVGGIAWPGGVLRHAVAPPHTAPPPTVPSSTTIPITGTTTPTRATSATTRATAASTSTTLTTGSSTTSGP